MTIARFNLDDRGFHIDHPEGRYMHYADHVKAVNRLLDTLAKVRRWMDAHPRKATMVESLKEEIRNGASLVGVAAGPDTPSDQVSLIAPDAGKKE